MGKANRERVAREMAAQARQDMTNLVGKMINDGWATDDPANSSGILAWKMQDNFGNEIVSTWSKTDIVSEIDDTPIHFKRTYHDVDGDYIFEITKDPKLGLLVSVEGSPWKNTPMSKEKIIYEWDMIWNTSGYPVILK